MEDLWQPPRTIDLTEHLQVLQSKRLRWERGFNPDYMSEFSKRPASTAGEALMAIAYIQVLMQQSHKAMRSLEYINPDGVAVNADQIIGMTYFARQQAQLNGLAGQQPVSDKQLIRYANILIEKLCTTLDPEKLQLAISGKEHHTWRECAEELLQSTLQPQRQKPALSDAAPSHTDQPLTKPWSERIAPVTESAVVAAWKQARRAEAKHESTLLFRRTLFKRIAFLFPSYTDVS